MTNKTFILLAFLALSGACIAQNRAEKELSSWQFSRNGDAWQPVTVPHDWAIKGPFDKQWDRQFLGITQDGQRTPIWHTGRSGGLPWLGRGEYRTTINVCDLNARTELYFDGAMSEPVVYVNGTEAGRWAYGYNAFRIDITPYLKQGDNEILVKLNNLEESSRWYPGAGLYRPVTLITTNKTYIDPWQTYFRTLAVSQQGAEIAVNAQTKGLKENDKLKTHIILKDKNGRTVAQNTVENDAKGDVATTFNIKNPQLWSPEHPYLYTLQICVKRGSKTLDATSQQVGIRTIAITKEHGFQLNGITRKFKGVCLHHDLGPLGAAANKAAMIRQIRIMKDMGVDAIRTAHNMPSQMQMQVCDSMGMMVMAESFDAWKEPKVKNGYNRFYDEWWRKDLTNLILGHRNHPSIVMWSIGNEIPEQANQQGTERAKAMVKFCHSLDSTRTVTCGVDNPEGSVDCGFYAATDVPGFNYRVFLYEKLIDKLPQGFLLGSETSSAVSSRGVYKFPVEEKNMATYADGQCSSYDVEKVSWGSYPDEDFAKQDDLPYSIGQFVWTGIDYIGEPTPYYSYWPSRSSYFAPVDLAGLPKDRYYLYRSVWNTSSPTLHLLPHWTWHGREGKVTPVYCYTSYPEAELFVNGKSQGRIKKNKASKLDRYRLRWNNVVYEPGELKVVAYDEKGKEVAQQTVHTAGAPHALKIEVDKQQLANDGKDLLYYTISMVDKDGNLCPDANDLLLFEVSGAARFKAVCNGDATSLEPFHLPNMHLFHGKLVVTVQSNGLKGQVHLTVKAPKFGFGAHHTL